MEDLWIDCEHPWNTQADMLDDGKSISFFFPGETCGQQCGVCNVRGVTWAVLHVAWSRPDPADTPGWAHESHDTMHGPVDSLIIVSPGTWCRNVTCGLAILRLMCGDKHGATPSLSPALCQFSPDTPGAYHPESIQHIQHRPLLTSEGQDQDYLLKVRIRQSWVG